MLLIDKVIPSPFCTLHIYLGPVVTMFPYLVLVFPVKGFKTNVRPYLRNSNVTDALLLTKPLVTEGLHLLLFCKVVYRERKTDLYHD